MTQRGGRLPRGTGCLVIIIVIIAVIGIATISNAGIFRKGKVFPLIRNRVIINDRNPTPATPNPPPIITVAPPILAPVPEPSQLNNDLSEEQLDFVTELVMKAEDSAGSSKYPPWLPLSTTAGGAGIALLALLRKTLGSI